MVILRFLPVFWGPFRQLCLILPSWSLYKKILMSVFCVVINFVLQRWRIKKRDITSLLITHSCYQYAPTLCLQLDLENTYHVLESMEIHNKVSRLWVTVSHFAFIAVFIDCHEPRLVAIVSAPLTGLGSCRHNTKAITSNKTTAAAWNFLKRSILSIFPLKLKTNMQIWKSHVSIGKRYVDFECMN